MVRLGSAERGTETVGGFDVIIVRTSPKVLQEEVALCRIRERMMH